MTSNYNKLDKIVKAKFGTMQAFSKLVFDNLRKLNGIAYWKDTELNRDTVRHLIQKANETEMDASKVYITPFDIKVIKGRMKVIINARNQNSKGVYFMKQWFEDNDYLRQRYDQVINGHNMYKNENYDRLIELLGIK